MSDFDDQPEERDENDVPLRFFTEPGAEAGVYAHTVAVWHTAYDFTLDFAVTELMQPSNPADPESPPEVPARIVARVRIPPTLVFDLIRTINARMAAYEKEWGEIQRPEPREQGESDDDR